MSDRKIAVAQWGNAVLIFFKNSRNRDFSIEALREFYIADPNWHEVPGAVAVKAAYRFEIHQIFGNHQGQVVISICRDCRIEFLTSRSNEGRDDMRCMFGCRESQRKRESNRRSVEYYRSDAGRKKKKAINQRRSKCGEPEHRDTGGSAQLSVHQYYRWLIRIIDGVKLGLRSIADVVASILVRVRQHSLEKIEKTGQIPDS